MGIASSRCDNATTTCEKDLRDDKTLVEVNDKEYEDLKETYEQVALQLHLKNSYLQSKASREPPMYTELEVVDREEAAEVTRGTSATPGEKRLFYMVIRVPSPWSYDRMTGMTG